ncbi:Disulfide bond formation protein D precursor [Pseudovibrio sp. W64]|uniref:DsbA family protein n=1 Tax=unclassified Pseudovibrio TaxID=2627060 RepID=UPI000709A5B4|nr:MULTISPECIES: DsbA family protein [unclassified Pseudovibrio]KZK85192.1 Disulfide bond formation protein D precursor [Pseudovibrio sp. Ad13]KZK90158.1 Disulfide bond formation protein D precursor [Pseudovibrio sp. Ad5]KZK90657.1 Disulfide bond formation protein D precursor [Pseudovibrio sp. W64]KZK91457.1 Disulfide bond formation protein D precursor [Pseudovibrio sp. Ad46]KZK94099.1 Disulfide bond formation protein D precursor [Pseudovibrio sp. W74]
MTLSRRKFLERTSALTAASLAFAAMPTVASAQTYSEADLNKVGPLGDKVIGQADAPVTVIEYASLTCGHCANFHNTTYKELKKKYIDTGKVRFIFREFPLDTVAAAGFMLARCAPEDKYFDIMSLMFEQQRSWAFTNDPYSALLNMGKQLGFTEEAVKACLTNQEILDGVTEVRDYGSDTLGVDSTPTFFINGEKVSGALSLEEFSKYVDKNL